MVAVLVPPPKAPPGPPAGQQALLKLGSRCAAAAVIVALLLYLASGAAGGAATIMLSAAAGSKCGVGAQGWNPMMLSKEDRMWIHDWARTNTVNSLAREARRQLGLELGVGVLRLGIPGDIVETGVAAGGSAVLIAKALEKYDPRGSRVLWAADSFQGLPPPVEKDAGPLNQGAAGAYAFGEQIFRDNLAKFNVTMDRVRILKGWFNETLPQAPIGPISYLRLDGDLYVSTADPLEALYDKVVPGGIIYVDDYGSFNGCRRAVDEFRRKRGITAPLQWQYIPDGNWEIPARHNAWEAVWWVKE